MQTENDPDYREAPTPFMCPTCQAHFATITECDAHVREAHPKPPEMTADEAIAIVDGWGPEQQFGLHRIARTLRLGEIIGEAYQVVGVLAYYANVFDHPDVIRALDKFSDQKTESILPWPKEELRNDAQIDPAAVSEVELLRAEVDALKGTVVPQWRADYDKVATDLARLHDWINNTPLVAEEWRRAQMRKEVVSNREPESEQPLRKEAASSDKTQPPPIAEGAQPSAEDMDRAQAICPGPTDTVEARHYTEPLIPEIAAALAAVRREALEQAAHVATRKEDAYRAELDHDSGNVASNIADAIRALIAAPAPHTGPVPHAIAWKREWLDIAERLDRLADHAERQANDRVTALVAGWARQLRNLLYADVNGGLEDEYMDYPDPPDRTAPHTDGEGG